MIIPTPQPPALTAPYRLKRGTKLADSPPQPPAPPVPSLSDLNGPFQLAEYLALKVKHDPHDIKGLITVPTGDGTLGGKAPDSDVWIYEHLRRLPIDLTPLITALLPICTRETCPQMRSSEWSYFCVAHGNGTQECSTIDYILHTLDSTVTLLNSSKSFPSRMQIPPASLSHFPSIFRRLSRIFSHAYFHHREAFILAESETSLYARFVALCEKYELVGERLLVIPKEVVGEYDRGTGGAVMGEDKGGEDGPVENQEQPESLSPQSLSPQSLSPQSLSPPADSAGPSSTPSTSTGPSSTPATPAPAQTPPSPLPPPETFSRASTLSRGTLSRGKHPRTSTSLLWAAAADPSPAPAVVSPAVGTSQGQGQGQGQAQGMVLPEDESVWAGRARSESVHSMVRISELEDALESEPAPEPASAPAPEPTEASVDPPAPIPKDEIELLEEEGKLAPAPTVAPLPLPLASVEGARKPEEVVEEGAVEAEKQEEEDGEMEEVKLDAEPLPGAESTPEAGIEALAEPAAAESKDDVEKLAAEKEEAAESALAAQKREAGLVEPASEPEPESAPEAASALSAGAEASKAKSPLEAVSPVETGPETKAEDTAIEAGTKDTEGERQGEEKAAAGEVKGDDSPLDPTAAALAPPAPAPAPAPESEKNGSAPSTTESDPVSPAPPASAEAPAPAPTPALAETPAPAQEEKKSSLSKKKAKKLAAAAREKERLEKEAAAGEGGGA